jgi:hypothetical protein
MMKTLTIYSVMLISLLSSCGVVKKNISGTNRYEDYREDLTSSRITFDDIADQSSLEVSDGEAGELSIDAALDQALQNVASANKAERYYSGFTVLIYSGVDREMAFKTRNDLYTLFPDIKSELQYQQPRYLLKVGNYTNRIEAQAVYHKVKDLFPSARIIQDRFQRETPTNSEETENGERQD